MEILQNLLIFVLTIVTLAILVLAGIGVVTVHMARPYFKTAWAEAKEVWSKHKREAWKDRYADVQDDASDYIFENHCAAAQYEKLILDRDDCPPTLVRRIDRLERIGVARGYLDDHSVFLKQTP